MELSCNKTNATYTCSIRDSKDLMGWKQIWIAHIMSHLTANMNSPHPCLHLTATMQCCDGETSVQDRKMVENAVNVRAHCLWWHPLVSSGTHVRGLSSETQHLLFAARGQHWSCWVEKHSHWLLSSCTWKCYSFYSTRDEFPLLDF